MAEFPRTTVGGVSVSRMIIGTNWFLGYSHTSAAKDRFITSYQTAKNIADIITVFLDNGVDTLMGMTQPILQEAIQTAQDRTGRKVITIYTPSFNVLPGGPPESEPERMFDYCQKVGATFCFPHTSTTDLLIDRMHGIIRDIDKYTHMIRERGMIPGLSTHMPEAVTIADQTGADIETYVQIYNAIGFLMAVEVDWEMRVIQKAKKPVMTIKPMARPPFAAGWIGIFMEHHPRSGYGYGRHHYPGRSPRGDRPVVRFPGKTPAGQPASVDAQQKTAPKLKRLFHPPGGFFDKPPVAFFVGIRPAARVRSHHMVSQALVEAPGVLIDLGYV